MLHCLYGKNDLEKSQECLKNLKILAFALAKMYRKMMPENRTALREHEECVPQVSF